jgi:hypothetical protein
VIYSLAVNWLRKLHLRYLLHRHSLKMTEWQALIIEAKDSEIRQLKLAGLAMQQAQRDLVAAWRVSLEKPEIDIRDDLDVMLRNLSDQIAILEEQIVA